MEFSGKNLYMTWVHAGGTVVMSGDYRTCTYEPSIDLYEATAGSDANKSYVAGVKDGRVSVSLVAQEDGTVLTNAVAEGTPGTLYISPEGTASGNRKMTIPAIALGARFNIPYNDIVEIQVDFQQNGLRVDGVN